MAHAPARLATTSDEGRVERQPDRVTSIGGRYVDNVRKRDVLSRASIDNEVRRDADFRTRPSPPNNEIQSMESKHQQTAFDELKTLIAKLAARRWHRLQVENQLASKQQPNSKETPCTTTDFGSTTSDHAPQTNQVHFTKPTDTK